MDLLSGFVLPINKAVAIVAALAYVSYILYELAVLCGKTAGLSAKCDKFARNTSQRVKNWWVRLGEP